MPQPSDAPPQPFGKYLLDAELAEGGMARVFRARLRGPGGFEKRLVVKQILPKLALDPGFIELFVREANTLVQMSHPNVVPIYELGVVDGIYFLAMELVEGATVAELLRDGPLPEALAAHIGAQVCEALRYAHERFDLIHRDVTPRNVIADADGHVRLLDFGIAAPPSRTGSGELFGSPGYMSPEQRRGEALCAQSDLFSLGSVLYEGLTGQRALPRPDAPPAVLGEQAELSGELTELVNGLLALDPAARPASAAEVAARLRTWLAQKHPEGVARALGKRVEQARTRSARGSERPPSPLESSSSGTPRVTRSIATSQTLHQLLAASTEALPRPSAPLPEGQPPAPAKPARQPWLPIALVITSIALLAGLVLTQREPVTARLPAPPVPATRPQPLASASATASPPGPAIAPTPAPPRALATSPSPASDPATVPARARLTINALPWADLQLDGRALGTTPKRALALPAGAHVLQLDCPPLGRKARVPLKLTPGTHHQVLVDLNTDPPKVTQQ